MAVFGVKDDKETELNSGSPNTKVALLIPITICVFLFATSVSVVFPSLDVLDSKRLFQTGIIPLVFVIALLTPVIGKAMCSLLRRTPKLVMAGFLVFFLLGITSSLRFIHPAYSLVDVGMIFSLILLVFVVASSRIASGHVFDRVSLVFVAIIGAAVMLQESMGLLVSLSLGNEFSYDNMFIYFAHPRLYNHIQTWTLPLLAAIPFVFPESKRAIGIAILLLAIQWYLLLASGARGSIVSLILAISLIGILALPNTKKWLKLHVAGALSGIFIYISIWQIQKFVADDSTQFIAQSIGRSMAHTTGRTRMWGFAWEDALQHPWLGAGPARFTCNADAMLVAHPHNIVFQLLGEWGFPATLIILGVVFYLVWKLLGHLRSLSPSKRSKTSMLFCSLAAAVIAAAVHSSVSGLLVMPASQTTAAFVGGWLLGSVPSTKIDSDKTWIFSLVLIVGLASSLAIVKFAESELHQFDIRLQNFSYKDYRAPRFWHEGRLCKFVY